MTFCQALCNWVFQPPLQLWGVGIYSHGCKQGLFPATPLIEQQTLEKSAAYRANVVEIITVDTAGGIFATRI